MTAIAIGACVTAAVAVNANGRPAIRNLADAPESRELLTIEFSMVPGVAPVGRRSPVAIVARYVGGDRDPDPRPAPGPPQQLECLVHFELSGANPWSDRPQVTARHLARLPVTAPCPWPGSSTGPHRTPALQHGKRYMLTVTYEDPEPGFAATAVPGWRATEIVALP